MKNVSKDFSTFEKFKLENPKVIFGGTIEIDPPHKPGEGGNTRP